MPASTTERFWSKVERGDPDWCWTWTAWTSSSGYGGFELDGRTVKAHRYAYEQLVGPIPEGLELDHLCFVPACVNPKHLEPVTHQENQRRGHGFPGQRARQQECFRGHPFDEANTYITSRGTRTCRTCQREGWMRRYRAKQGV